MSRARMIGVHLDLKGVAFRPDYIPALLADLAATGVDTLLVEYEDRFPFDGIEVACDPGSAWSRETLELFRAEAQRHRLEIIPLQQCLGHLEYVFRRARYQHLAEDRLYPSTLCVTSDEGKTLICEMLRQVIEAHPDSRYIHLGLDEAAALPRAAERLGKSVPEVLTDYLEDLLPQVEAAGKTPIIWSDMIEDHFDPDVYSRLRDRVVLSLWDYVSARPREPLGRCNGWRVSREWLADPADQSGPAISGSTRYFEDMPDRVTEIVAPFRHGRQIESFFGVDILTELGFRVIGATAIRVSSDGAILPRYLLRRDNIRQFAARIRKNKQLGLIGTSWARGNTFCPPNFLIDLTWPLIEVLAKELGAQPRRFFEGVPRETLDRILGQLSRCRDDWSIEPQIVAELEDLAPLVQSHQYEWQSLVLATRILAVRRQLDATIKETEYFEASDRLISQQWQRRLDDQAKLVTATAALRQTCDEHFRQRYHGRHLDEWFRFVFDLPIAKLNRCSEVCERKLQQTAETES